MHNVEVSKNRLKEIVKLHQKKYRDELGMFIAEGSKILDEILENDVEVIEIYSLKEIENIKTNACVHIVDENIMKKISSTSSACDVLTVAKKKNVDLNEFKTLNNIILTQNISDPGNLGTIIRSAAAFNFEGLILYGNCVDLYSPKVIRSCAGNFFKIKVVEIKSIETIKKDFKQHVKIATALSKENNISLKDCAEIPQKIIMFGAEATGLSEELINIAQKNIRLEMKNRVDSLNLGVCASIVMYELQSLRQ